MKRNPERRGRTVCMVTMISFALLLLFAAPQRAVAQWTTSGNNISNTNTGNVGIGTASPSQRLDVVASTNNTYDGIVLRPNNLSQTLSFGYYGILSSYTLTLGNTSANPLLLITNNTERMRIDSSGNVGIGTSTPNRKLELIQDVGGLSFEVGSGSPNSGTIRFGDNTGWKLHFGRSRESNGGALNSGTSGALVTIQDNGNFGIGTTSPGYKLDVNGTVNATGLNINGAPIAGSVFGRTGAVVAATNDYTWAQIDKTTSSLANLTTRSAGDLSSGTLPDARFPATLPAVSGANLTALNASSLASGTVGAARLGSGTADATTFLRGDNTWAVPSGATQWTTSGSNINYATSGGNVGIGQSNPTYKLDVGGAAHVTGNMTVDGNLAAKYQDLAEWVPASEQLSAGTVVVLDSTKSNQVTSSTQAYDTRVAGVISAQPGIALGERSANKVLVATTGRVRVKVDATRAPIHIGDLLVTSDIPGMAMKSEPVNIGGVLLHRPGTLIGKALEPLGKGQGTILVLLSLQ